VLALHVRFARTPLVAARAHAMSVGRTSASQAAGSRRTTPPATGCWCRSMAGVDLGFRCEEHLLTCVVHDRNHHFHSLSADPEVQPSHSQWNAKDVRGRVRRKSDIDLIIVKKIAIFFIPLDPISQYHSSGPIARPEHGIPQASSRRRRERHDNALLHVDQQSDVPPQDQPARIIKFVIKNSGLNSPIRESYIMTMHEESATHASGNPDAERNDHDYISGNVHCRP